jgi:hypothetical protein
MYRHRHFDLLLHEDEELGELLGDRVVSRKDLHEWPLSCVQEVCTAGGRRLVYKAQREPSVEPAFYSAARSSLLAAAEVLHDDGMHTCMAVDYIDAPLAEDLDLTEQEALDLGAELLEMIGRIEGDLPHHLDIGSAAGWRALVDETLQVAFALAAEGTFANTGEAVLARLERHALSEDVLALFSGPMGYVHGDLTGDNVFVLDGGYRVVDWQRPLLGPTVLDLALLLGSLGFDPLLHVGSAAMVALAVVGFHWLTMCAARWIPSVGSYDSQAAAVVDTMERYRAGG